MEDLDALTPPGWTGAARRLGATVLDMAATRLALAAVEFEEERRQVTRLWVVFMLATLLGVLALALALALLVLLAPAPWRPAVLAACASAVATAAAALMWWHRAMSLGDGAPWSATIETLRQDAQALKGAGR